LVSVRYLVNGLLFWARTAGRTARRSERRIILKGMKWT
jgi:hypothetical protein